MDARDPQQWVNEPLRRALDGVLYRWLALFCVPVAAAAIHKMAASGTVDGVIHLCIPIFLAGYVGVHLVGRIFWRKEPDDGWTRAGQADRATVALTRTIGWVTVVGAGLAIVAPLGTLLEPRQFLMEVLLWFPLLFPLYALAVWVTIDCAQHRLGKGADQSEQRFHEYWRRVSSSGRPPA
jgi:carbon starvation protein CstA